MILEIKKRIWMVFGFGKLNIEKMEKNRDIQGLIKAFNYGKDEEIRENEARALSRTDDALALENLILLSIFDNNSDSERLLQRL